VLIKTGEASAFSKSGSEASTVKIKATIKASTRDNFILPWFVKVSFYGQIKYYFIGSNRFDRQDV
jgi:hypothetical protein